MVILANITYGGSDTFLMGPVIEMASSTIGGATW